MNLLLKRSQFHGGFSMVPLRIGKGTLFELRAELELDEEEKELLKRYKLSSALLVEGDAREALAKALRAGLLFGVVAFFLLNFLSRLAPSGGQSIPGRSVFSTNEVFAILFLVVFTMTLIQYRALRERLVVSDLLDGGRVFTCDSVVDLIKKEAFLEGTAGYLRQLIESAKHWGDREVIPIKPLDKDEAKRAVLRAG